MRLRWLLLGLLTAMLLVPALLVSTARALDLPGGLWVRLVAFTPYATLLYLVAAFVLLITWLRGHGGVAVRVLTMLCLVGVAVHAYWASGPYLGSSPAEAAYFSVPAPMATWSKAQNRPSYIIESMICASPIR